MHTISETLSEDTKKQLGPVDLDRVAVIILGGGEGKRLEPLTKNRCKPAISFGGKYSLIDVPISHSLSTGLKKIYVIGQYLATSLHKHLVQNYYSRGHHQIEMLSPEERDGKKIWYQGTADAIRQNLPTFSAVAADYFLVLSGDHLYNINFEEMIRFAMQTDASMVLAAQPVTAKDAPRLGLLKMEKGNSKLIDFCEKPKEKELLDQYHTDQETLHHMGYDTHNGRSYLGSMGIYLFKKQAMIDLLNHDLREDFGKHLIKTEMDRGSVHVYLYDGYWEDIGTVESYYHANLALMRLSDDRKSGFQFYDEKNPILSKTTHLPGAKIANTIVNRSLLCEGSVIEAQEISHSVIGVRSVVKRGVIIRDSILMGNEFYEATIDGRSVRPGIGEFTVISKAIIDENVTIGRGVRLLNQDKHTHYDAPQGKPEIFVRDGIIIVPRGTTIPDGFVF